MLSARPARSSTPSKPDVEITKAQSSDRSAIAKLLKQTWRITYVNDDQGVTQADIDSHTRQWADPDRVPIPKRLQAPNVLRLVAKADGQIVGYCQVRQNKYIGRLQVLHVIPGYQSRGIGAALMDAGLKWLNGSLPIHLKVVRYNERAIKFYEKFGFRVSRKFAVRLRSGKLLPKYEMVKEP